MTKKAIAIDPKHSLAYFNRGLAKSAALGDKKGAIADYHSKAITINPQFAPAYYNRGNAKDDLGDVEGQAIADFSKAIEANPQHVKPY